MFSSNLTEFHGLNVVDFEAGTPLADLDTTCCRIGLDWESEDTIVERLTALLGDPAVDRLKGLLIGAWFTEDPYDGEVETTVAALVAASSQLASLTSLFVGDITSEQCEVSWIQQGDLSSLFPAYPRLEHFQSRGAEGLKIGPIHHDCLKSIRIESGGLPSEVLRDLGESSLPALESLTIYLGADTSGWDGSVSDVEKLLANSFPKLTHLALVDSEIQDDVTKAIVASDLLPQLTSLDLSLGVFTDDGANALLGAAGRLVNLNSIQIEHHYMSKEVEQKLASLPCQVELSDGNSPDDEYKYVVCGE